MKSNNLGKKIYSVALYMRLSKEDGDKEESESIANQRKILNGFVKENNYKVYDEYIDDGYSGTNFNRPDFKRLIQDIESGKVNMVITKNLARLGRDYIETGRYIETYFPEREIRYIALLDDVDTFLDRNCDTVAIKNIMNDYYARETSKNIKRTKNRKKKEGFYYVSYAPYGYRKIDKAGHLEIDEIAAEVVRRIYKDFLNGMGTYQIAQALNAEGITTPGLHMNMSTSINNLTDTTDKWRHTTVKRILINPIYIGTIVQNKCKKISYKSKKMINLSEEEHTIMKNHHEAIIDIEIWETVQKIFENSKTVRIKKEDPLLKPLLYCSHCHNRLQVIKKTDKYKDKVTSRRYIYCGTATKKISNQKCYNQYLNYDKFEIKILNQISEILTKYLSANEFKSDEVVKFLINSTSKQSEYEEKIQKLNKQLASVNKKNITLYNDKLNGIIEEQDYILFSESLKNERHNIEKSIQEIESEIERLNTVKEPVIIEGKIKKIIKKVVKEQKYDKEDLHQLIDYIEIDKDKNINIHFNFIELNCIGGKFSYDDRKAVNS